MLTSPEINEICGALSQAQGELGPAPFDKTNPHFKSKYASLSSCKESSKKVLAKHGLCVVQLPITNTNDGLVGVVTRLAHKSGQFFEETNWCRPKSISPQDVGSAISYLRRYGYSAVIGQPSDDDDDGNQAQGLNAATNDVNARLAASKAAPKQDKHSERTARCLAAFAELGITQKQIETKLGYPVAKCSDQDFDGLLELFGELKENPEKAATHFVSKPASMTERLRVQQ